MLLQHVQPICRSLNVSPTATPIVSRSRFVVDTMDIERNIKKIVALPDKQTAKDALNLLIKIIENIVNHPDEEKYRTLSSKNKTLHKLISENEEFVSILLQFGFRKTVVDFEEKWILGRVGAIDVAKLSDFLSILKEYGAEIYVPTKESKEAYVEGKARKSEHRAYIESILKAAEMDREEVKERNEKWIASLKSKTGRKLS